MGRHGVGTAAAGGRFHAWPPTECRPQRGPRCWLWRGEAGPRVQTRALPHLLRAIDDRFQEERGGLPIVSLDQRSVGRHRCQLIGKDALVERDEVALGAGILEPGKLLLPVRVLCQHLLQLWHKWAGSGRPSVPCRGPAGNQSRRVPAATAPRAGPACPSCQGTMRRRRFDTGAERCSHAGTGSMRCESAAGACAARGPCPAWPQ